MDKTGKDKMVEQLRLLNEKMNASRRVRDTDLANCGWISRQSLNNERNKNGGQPSFATPSSALALILLAWERGYVVEVLTILNGQELTSKFGTMAQAALMFPDLSFEEADMLRAHEAAFARAGKTLQTDLIRSLTTAFRAPSD